MAHVGQMEAQALYGLCTTSNRPDGPWRADCIFQTRLTLSALHRFRTAQGRFLPGVSPMLFDPFSARSLQLANRMVMAPLTRSRATPHHTPNALMATYYGQRATAGLIITEGTSPSPNGLGYPRIPGLYDTAQAQAWKATTTAVHAKSGKIFVQFMHCGRVAHVANLPAGAEVLGPGTAVCPGEMYTDTLGMQPHSPPRAMTDEDLAHVIDEYVAAAKLAVDAGFDGVELHGANGYLIEQFLNPLVNLRTDGYGGSNERRNRLALEIARATVAAIGRDRVGMRLSPARSLRCRSNTWRWSTRSLRWVCCTCTWSTIRPWARRQCPRISSSSCAPASTGCSSCPGVSITLAPNRPWSTSEAI